MKKILLIDDDEGILDLLSQYLSEEGFKTFTAEDGPSGLKAAHSFSPDLIVLDVMLPGFDGLELLTRLRQTSDVYVIMLTAKTEETVMLQTEQLTAGRLFETFGFRPLDIVSRFVLRA